jgi:hypothetical protein
MTTKTKKLGFICATALALTFARSGAVRAVEPTDNTPPWGTNAALPVVMQNVTAYITNQPGSGWGAGPDRQITPSGDVDYAVIGCGSANGVVPKGTIKEIRVGFTHASGDIDIDVLDPTGKLLGQSHGITNLELVDLSALAKNAAVLKVYGFNGATNFYSVTVVCQ